MGYDPEAPSLNCREAEQLQARADRAEMALHTIWNIVRTPTKNTSHRKADDHFMADFDAIRKIILEVKGNP